MYRLAEADVVLTTYNIVSREVQVPDELKDKHSVDMPATDTALVCLSVLLTYYFINVLVIIVIIIIIAVITV